MNLHAQQQGHIMGNQLTKTPQGEGESINAPVTTTHAQQLSQSKQGTNM
jgi:hypothetical protein